MNRIPIQYLRIILTNHCNLQCQGCHREGQDVDCVIPYDDLMLIVDACVRAGILKIKLMGGEPTLRNDILDIISGIKKRYKEIDLSLITNGTAPIELYNKCFELGLDRLNFSLHGFSERYFVVNTQSQSSMANRVFSNLKTLLNDNRINKINYVIKKEHNEEDLHELLNWLKQYPGTQVDVLNYLSPMYSPLFYSMDEIGSMLDKWFGIVERKQVSNKYSLPSTHLKLSTGTVINLKTNQLRDVEFLQSCSHCEVKDFCQEGITAIRLCTDYRIQPCLFRNDNCLHLKPHQTDYFRDIQDYLIHI